MNSKAFKTRRSFVNCPMVMETYYKSSKFVDIKKKTQRKSTSCSLKTPKIDFHNHDCHVGTMIAGVRWLLGWYFLDLPCFVVHLRGDPAKSDQRAMWCRDVQMRNLRSSDKICSSSKSLDWLNLQGPATLPCMDPELAINSMAFSMRCIPTLAWFFNAGIGWKPFSDTSV